MNETALALTADCAKCAALCCVALAFDKGDKFAIDKPAGAPCPNLGRDHTCTIHAALTDKGFSGCVIYDCSGAGQRVTQTLFQGQSWQDNPRLLVPMLDAFRAMRAVHELLVLLGAAGALPLTEPERAKHNHLLAALTPRPDWTVDSLSEFETGPVPKQAQTFLRSLAHHIKR